MKEYERLKVISKIAKNIEDMETLNKESDKLKELEEDPKVKEYINTKKRVSGLKTKLKYFKSFDDIVSFEFEFAFHKRLDEDIEPCSHDIWIYDGSYYSFPDLFEEHPSEFRSNSERYEHFKYNKYVCLECGEAVKASSFEKFEENNLVLKNQDDKSNLGANFYRDLYYELLYNNDVEESKRQVISYFNKMMEKGKARILK